MTRIAGFLVAMLCSFSVLAAKEAPSAYTYSRVGNPADVAVAGPLPGGTVLMGGGTDVEAAFKWMCARMGNGDFLVLRATGRDTYNSYIRKLCPAVNSVATLILPSREAAKLDAVAAIVRQAEAIWIAGGDQSDYVNFWQGTPVTATLNLLLNGGVPIGGTSAGLNVLTQYVYSALGATGVTSAEALANPYDGLITFSTDFVNLPVLAGIIGDPHFKARDRMGRDLAFLCRLNRDYGLRRPRAIAVDEATALLVDEYGAATVANAPKSTGKVYFLEGGSPEQCVAGQPLTYTNVDVYRVGAKGAFDVAHWLGSGGTRYSVHAVTGTLSTTGNGGLIY